jgi:TM2 domain-containing membrane protein YozV
MILNRKDLREALLGAFGSGVLIAIAFWFRGAIEFYIGQTATSWLLNAFLLLYLLSLIPVLSGWLDIRNWERTERKQKEEDERDRAKWESEERQQQVEYNAFLNWVRQNPRTADRLMRIAEEKQIEDPEYRNWLIERREREDGPRVPRAPGVSCAL